MIYTTNRLSFAWGRGYDIVLGWLKARFGFTGMTATNTCLRGSCVIWRSSAGIDDGTGLPNVLPTNHYVKILNLQLLLFLFGDCCK